MFILTFWFGIALWTSGVASGRGRSGLGWFLLGFIFGPLALLTVWALPSRITVFYMCRAPVSALARKCPHCQTMLGGDHQRVPIQ